MFELNIALKYLLPKKHALSKTIISLVSVLIISLVVWLVLVFLSVTSGIEKNWLKKLTTLNAPLRLVPTNAYYSSYYYLIDSISSNSNYSYKSIREKSRSSKTNPYNPNQDMEIPAFWPNPFYTKDKKELDIIKETYQILEKQKTQEKTLTYEDFEMAGALMRITLDRPFTASDIRKVSYLSQMSYLLSLNQENPHLSQLLLTPSKEDFNNLLRQISKSSEKSDSLPGNNESTLAAKDSTNNSQIELPLKNNSFNSKNKLLETFFNNLKLEKVATTEKFTFPLLLFPKTPTFHLDASALLSADGTIKKLFLPIQKPKVTSSKNSLLASGTFKYEKKGFVFIPFKNSAFNLSGKDSFPVDENTIITSDDKFIFNARIDKKTISQQNLQDIKLHVNGLIQDQIIKGETCFSGLEIQQAQLKENPFGFNFYVQNNAVYSPTKHFDAYPALLPKPLKDNGSRLGDLGYLAFASQTPSAVQEMRLPIYVAGFYDPGILPIGGRCIIVPEEVIRTISGSNMILENQPNNGIFVWFDDLRKTTTVKTELENQLQAHNLSKYWQVQSYKDYEFSKDLMQQFQSDRLLLTLIALIIIVVACSNIISLLMLLINDKKKEIAILQSMGASKKSIALIFGFCGFTLGLLSAFLGTLAALFTLRHLDVLVNFLSFIQGHSAFNAAFFGDKLPNILSWDAFLFVAITTPIIALVAGLIPAIKACKLHPSSILRGD